MRRRRGHAILVAALVSISSTLAVVPARPVTAALQLTTAPSVTAAATPDGTGYWSVQSDGTVAAWGSARRYPGPRVANVVGIASSASGAGYWLATARGEIAAFGDATAYGSLASKPIAAPVVGIVRTPTGHGYWLTATDGGIFTFGDAPFYGSMGGRHLNQPIVGIAATPTGHGYWLTATDGGIFTFGDATFYGSMGGRHLNQPIVGVAATPTGHGYWLTATDGGIFTFGDAPFYGSMGGRHLNQPISQIAATPDGRGYWEFAIDGGVFTFGNARFYGALIHPLEQPRDFGFPFQDHSAPAPSSTWKQDQGVDVFLRGRGGPWCGSISSPSRRDGPVLVAVAGGTIVGAGISGFGPSAPILHVEQGALAGMYMYYGHSSGNIVSVGSRVKQGQAITHVGCGIVGRSDEPHVEIGMSPAYPGVPPCGRGCHGSSTSGTMLRWLLRTR